MVDVVDEKLLESDFATLLGFSSSVRDDPGRDEMGELFRCCFEYWGRSWSNFVREALRLALEPVNTGVRLHEGAFRISSLFLWEDLAQIFIFNARCSLSQKVHDSVSQRPQFRSQPRFFLALRMKGHLEALKIWRPHDPQRPIPSCDVYPRLLPNCSAKFNGQNYEAAYYVAVAEPMRIGARHKPGPILASEKLETPTERVVEINTNRGGEAGDKRALRNSNCSERTTADAEKSGQPRRGRPPTKKNIVLEVIRSFRSGREFTLQNLRKDLEASYFGGDDFSECPKKGAIRAATKEAVKLEILEELRDSDSRRLLFRKI